MDESGKTIRIDSVKRDLTAVCFRKWAYSLVSGKGITYLSHLWRRAEKLHFSSVPHWHPGSGQDWNCLVVQSTVDHVELNSGWGTPQCSRRHYKIQRCYSTLTLIWKSQYLSKTECRENTGWGLWLAEWRTLREYRWGIKAGLTLGSRYPRNMVSLVTLCGAPVGTISENLWISWMTASVYGILVRSSRVGSRCEPITWSISFWTFSAQKRWNVYLCYWLCSNGIVF